MKLLFSPKTEDFGKEYVNRWVWNQNTTNTKDSFGLTYIWDNSDNELTSSCWGQMTAYINDSSTWDALRSLRGGISTFSEWLICGQGDPTTALSPPDEEDLAHFIIYNSYPKSQFLKKRAWVSQTDRFSSGRGFPVVDVRAIEEPDQERRLSTNHHNELYVQSNTLKILKVHKPPQRTIRPI